MVISDLNIICISQTAPRIAEKEGIFYDIVADHKAYGKDWRILNRTNGVWYQLSPTERSTTGRYDDEFFDLNYENGINYIVLLPRYRDALIELIQAYLAWSPVHEILVMIRLGDSESDQILEMDKEVFIKTLADGLLQFDKVYKIV